MKSYLVAAAGVLALLVPTLAAAQQVVTGERSYLQQRLPAPTRALELTVASGYTQGFGELRSNIGMPRVARAGVAIEGAVGYRVDPRWGVSVGGQYQELTPDTADATRGTAFTLAAQYHAAPNTRLDPWIEVGTGYRLLWQIDPLAGGGNVLTHGLQLARARIGFDIRVSPEVAIGPVIGADATTFLYQDGGPGDGYIRDPSVNTFVFAGLQGRIDAGGQVGTTTMTSARR
jgi:hypothetical protein